MLNILHYITLSIFFLNFFNLIFFFFFFFFEYSILQPFSILYQVDAMLSHFLILSSPNVNYTKLL